MNILDQFVCGQYQKCIQLLEKTKGSTFQLSYFQVKCNRAVCKLLRDLSDYSEDCMTVIVSCLKELQQCLLQIQSFPPSLIKMESELTILYNWLYLKLITQIHSAKHDIQALLCECGEEYLKSLSRVLSTVKFKQSCDTYREEEILFQLKLLSKYSEILKVYRILSPLCFAGCVWSYLLMFCGKLKQSLDCIESLVIFAEENTEESLMLKSPAGLLLSLSESDEHKSSGIPPSLSGHGMVLLLKGLCCFKLSQWTQCRECLLGICESTQKPYIKLLTGLCLLKDGHPDDCITSLQDLTAGDISLPPRIRARVLHLIGQCYDKKGLHQCAIQMFREALQVDFSYVLPLYHISQQYQKLGLEDAELEALNLLTTILEDKSTEASTSPSLPPVTSLWTSDIFHHTCPEPAISLIQALYTLAQRCLQLHRYKDGAPRFLDLLTLLCDSPHLPKLLKMPIRELVRHLLGDMAVTTFNHHVVGSELYYCRPQILVNGISSSCVLELPDIRVIYQETAECLLHAGSHQDCVSVCDKALECICLNLDTSVTSLGTGDLSHLLTDEDSQELSETITSSSRKRPRMESCDLGLSNQSSDCWQELKLYMTLTLYKADALIRLQEQDNAVRCLHRAIEALQECIGCWSEEEGPGMPQTTEPAPKRRRMVEDEVLISSDTSDLDSTSTWKPLFVDGCCKLSSLLADQRKYSDALHYSRLAVQIHPGDKKAWFTCCSVLHRQGREDEAAKTWLKQQGVEKLTDYQHLAKELHKKREQLRKLSSEPKDQEDSNMMMTLSKLEMDITSLQYCLQHRHSLHH